MNEQYVIVGQSSSAYQLFGTSSGRAFKSRKIAEWTAKKMADKYPFNTYEVVEITPFEVNSEDWEYA